MLPIPDDTFADVTYTTADVETSRDAPAVDIPDQTPTVRRDEVQEFAVAPTVIEANAADTVVEGPNDTIPLEAERELPVQPNQSQEKAPERMPPGRFLKGSISAQGSAIKNLEFEHALACSLQTSEDQEILGRLHTSELGIKAFQGLVSVSSFSNIHMLVHISAISMYACHVCFCRLPNISSN